MSLTSLHRLSTARLAWLLGASVGLHTLLLVGMIALGHRAVLSEPPPLELEMRLEGAVMAPVTPSEAAALPAALEPTHDTTKLADSVPVQTPPLAPLDAVAPMSPAMPAITPTVVPVAPPRAVRSAELAERPPPEPEVAPVIDRSPAPISRRVVPRQVVARGFASERRFARPGPAGETGVTIQAASAPSPAPARTIAISSQWQGELAGWIRARTHYPEEAKLRGEQGAVVVSFTVGRDGQVLEAVLRQRSGSETLDQAALAMFRAARVPGFPPDMEVAQITISVPVRYRLEQ